jgi:hypothetical protein
MIDEKSSSRSVVVFVPTVRSKEVLLIYNWYTDCVRQVSAQLEAEGAIIALQKNTRRICELDI